jgi:GT2 family glycosyltransferase
MCSEIKENDFVSIILCTYNRAKYIDGTLKSIFEQNYKNFEVVVINSSTDNTDEILSKYPVKVIKQEKKGIAAARNMGVKASSANILAFIDDDAVPDKNWLKTLVCALKNDPSVCGVAGILVEYGTDKFQFINGIVDFCGKTTYNTLPQKFYLPDGNIFNIGVTANMAVRKKAIEKVGGFDPYYTYFFEDTDICVRLIMSGCKIIHEPKAVVMHKMAPGPNRKSPGDENWYIQTRTNTYFSLKNFYDRFNPAYVKLGTFYWYSRKMMAMCRNSIKGDFPFSKLPECLMSMTKGYIDGYKDGIKKVKNNKIICYTVVKDNTEKPIEVKVK